MAETGRFNSSLGLGSIEFRPARPGDPAGLRRLVQKQLGREVLYSEEAFEWDYMRRFSVRRLFESGFLRSLSTVAEIEALPSGATRLKYEFQYEASGFLGRWIYRLGFRAFRPKLDRLFRELEARAKLAPRQVLPGASPLPPRVRWAIGGEERLSALLREWKSLGVSGEITKNFENWIRSADESDVAHFRPYEWADQNTYKRREVLEACVLATKIGLLGLRWEVICPACRGAARVITKLNEIRAHDNCESCREDFGVELDRLVEATFRIHPSVRPTDEIEFCTGGPGRTPHILHQRWLKSGESFSLIWPENGDYRIRFLGRPGQSIIRGAEAGVVFETRNQSNERALLVIERTQWTDRAATVRDLLALQKYRDFFSEDSVARGTVFPIGFETIVFTDLRSSTKLYREVGDAPAFDKVYRHFEVLRAEIEREEGAIVKTIGDAVMAVFHSPLRAVRALLSAQTELLGLGDDKIVLKVGVHRGPCLVVNLNDRTDYFGTTVNLASRLEGFSRGNDIVLSPEVLADSELANWLDNEGRSYEREEIEVRLKGFEDTPTHLLRLRRGL